jgi:chaperonin GroES
MIRPLGDRIVAVPPQVEAEEETASGIILPDSAKPATSEEIGVVKAVGAEAKLVKVGDRVLFPDHITTKEYKGEEYYIESESEILAVLEDSEE